jgi:aryl-alcohol dehydrogenase-like predicted oxidoreductase
VSRSIEREHIPLARELGISVTPWSPLGSGFLTGKFERRNGQIIGSGRVAEMKDSGNPTLEKFSKREQNWAILETLLQVAKDLGRTPAEVALAWVMSRPCVTSTLVGATRVEQLEKNLATAEVVLPQDALQRLDAVSAPEANELDHFFGDVLQSMVNGGTKVERTKF